MNKLLRNMALTSLFVLPSFSVSAELQGKGTETEPYLITSASDLCEAYNYVSGQDIKVYFVQTADIDMAGVTEYHAISGHNGLYLSKIYYDGQNHTISNFAPADHPANNPQSTCYCTSIFGVPSGWIKNLGVIDAKVETVQGAGVLGAYAGFGNAAKLSVENVYVTGSVTGTGGYTGGLFGTTGNEVTFTNCYFNGSVNGKSYVGGLVGRARNKITLNNSYVAGSVAGADESAKTALVASSDKNNIAVEANGFVAFNSGADNAFIGCTATGDVDIATAENKAALVAKVKSWEAFNAKREYDGYPALNWQSNGYAVLEGAGTEAAPYIIDSPEALAIAYKYVSGQDIKVYFVQTADIDMAGVTEYHSISGHNGLYLSKIYYDGQSHTISNFAPADHPANNPQSTCYCTSIFGVPSGWIKNLGVIDAKVETVQGAGVLGAYAGFGNAAKLSVENVYVTGSVTGTGGYTGGLFGTTGNEVTLTNCYFNGSVNGKSYVGGLIGRARNKITINNSYVAGTVAGADESAKIALVASSDKNNIAVEANGFVAFNSGADNAFIGCTATGDVDIATEKNKKEMIAKVQTWEAFNERKRYENYPALNWQENAVDGIVDIIEDNSANNAPAEYYNLQGVKVTNPAAGIYIVRRGNKVTKEYIR